MTLTIGIPKVSRWGKDKIATYKVTDSDGSGGTLDVSQMFSHIDNVIITDLTRAVAVTARWTDDSESITIGSEGTSADVYKVTVIGS